MRSKLKTAIVYDWLDTQAGGAERVLQVLLEIYPEAEIFSPFTTYPDWLPADRVRTSWLQNLPNFLKNRKILSIFLPLAFESFNFNKYDQVISVCSAFSKGVITQPNQLHVCYLLSPPRFLYTHADSYFSKTSLLLLKPFIYYWRRWDQIAAHRPDYIIPISQLIKSRVEKIYALETEPPFYPCYTPLSLKKTSKNKQADYWLVVSRYAKYKNIDLAIKACQKADQKLVIVGHGNKENLGYLVTNQSLVNFIEHATDHKLSDLYGQANGLLMLGEEDFGIVGLEALAHQTPVVVNSKSGVAELITQQVGVKLESISIEKIIAGLEQVRELNFSVSSAQRIIDLTSKRSFKAHFVQQITRLKKMLNKDHK